MWSTPDSIQDVDRLRYAASPVAFTGTRVPSTVGTFLRALTHGHVQQLNAVLRQPLVALAGQVALLPGSEEVVFVDVDSIHRQVYGYAKYGAQAGGRLGEEDAAPVDRDRLDTDRAPGGGADAEGKVGGCARLSPVPGHRAVDQSGRADRGPSGLEVRHRRHRRHGHALRRHRVTDHWVEPVREHSYRRHRRHTRDHVDTDPLPRRRPSIRTWGVSLRRRSPYKRSVPDPRDFRWPAG